MTHGLKGELSLLQVLLALDLQHCGPLLDGTEVGGTAADSRGEQSTLIKLHAGWALQDNFPLGSKILRYLTKFLFVFHTGSSGSLSVIQLTVKQLHLLFHCLKSTVQHQQTYRKTQPLTNKHNFNDPVIRQPLTNGSINIH